MGDVAWGWLVKDSIGDSVVEVLLQLTWIDSARLGQGLIVNFASVGNGVRNLEVANISHGTDILELTDR